MPRVSPEIDLIDLYSLYSYSKYLMTDRRQGAMRHHTEVQQVVRPSQTDPTSRHGYAFHAMYNHAHPAAARMRHHIAYVPTFLRVSLN
jgi:hypothetical protein